VPKEGSLPGTVKGKERGRSKLIVMKKTRDPKKKEGEPDKETRVHAGKKMGVQAPYKKGEGSEEEMKIEERQGKRGEREEKRTHGKKRTHYGTSVE